MNEQRTSTAGANDSGQRSITPAARMAQQCLEARPRLRDDVVFRPQRISDRVVYVVEDPIVSKFYRLGRTEYLFAAALDGHRTVRESLALANRHTVRRSGSGDSNHAQPQAEAAQAVGAGDGQQSDVPADPLTEAEALAIYHWAAQNELLDREIPPRLSAPAAAPLDSAQQILATWNLITLRLPGFCPEPLLARIQPYFNWLYSSWANGAALLVIAFACMRLLPRWDQFSHSLAGVFSPAGQLSLLVGWILLKVIHELSHGLVCRRYGGNVRSAGVMFILFVPLAYVDVTSSWRFRSKWQRIHTAAAGMQLELYLAALAAILWSYTAPGALNQACANVVLMSSITTVLFNANPLMRFDGYYILTDWLELPNLYASGQSWLQSLGRRVFLGLPGPRWLWSSGCGASIRLYAVLAFAWRLFVCAGLIVAAAYLWHGAGILLAALAIGLWVGVPLVKFVQYFLVGSREARPRRLRFLFASLATALGTTMLLTLVPWPGAIRAPAIVQYDPLTVVRAQGPGFIDQVRVTSGAQVVAGQVLATLRNPELECQYAQMQLEVEAQRARARGLLDRRELAAYKSQLRECEAVEVHLAELKRQIEGLCIRAPVAGQVVSRGVDRLPGQYLQQGDEVVSLGDETRKQVQFSVPQDQLTDFHDSQGQPVVVSLAALDICSCQIQGIEPRASRRPLDAALCTPHGGPLVVRSTTSNRPRGNSLLDGMELLAPRFTGTVTLSKRQSRQVRAGQRASVGLGRRRHSLGQHLFYLFDQWLSRQVASAST